MLWRNYLQINTSEVSSSGIKMTAILYHVPQNSKSVDDQILLTFPNTFYILNIFLIYLLVLLLIANFKIKLRLVKLLEKN